MKLTEELCEVIGAYMGDGCTYNSKNCHYLVQYSGDSRLDREYYNSVIGPYINNLFGSKACFKKVKGKNAIRINFYSKKFYYFLKKFFNLKSNKKADIIFIPKIIFDNEKNLHALIRGLFDTDGGIYLDKRHIYKKPYPRIIFCTVSKKLHNQLIEYLSKHFKIYSHQRKYKNSNHKDSYSIEIYGQKQLNKWINLIGFSNPRHLSKVPM
jgi:intein/homing endonuclease